jgi:hypothetical protein
MITNIGESTKELVNKEHLIVKQYQVGFKDIKCPFKRWNKHETLFFAIGFLAHKIFGMCWITN